jgi:prepilin-type N-terminal cleavage/methylation domain-containing protein
MTRVRQPRSRLVRRPGFTLIEMLIVVAIIGILVALTAGAVMQVMATQQDHATEATLEKLDNALDHQWKAVIDAAKDEWRKSQPVSGLQGNLMTWAGNSPDQAKAGYVQLRLMQEFPVNLTEATVGVSLPPQNGVNPGPSLPAKASYVKALAGVPTGQGVYNESAVCFFLAMSQSHRGMVNSLEEATGQSANRPLATMNNKSVYVDSWSNPIWLERGTNNQFPVLKSAGRNKVPGDSDDLSSGALRATGSRGDT